MQVRRLLSVRSGIDAEGVALLEYREAGACRVTDSDQLAEWNPSTLEQRTGRIDRIGSKAEAVRQPVVIYEPYIGGTHDEKMFRVVKDRERWFGVVMGKHRTLVKLRLTAKRIEFHSRLNWRSGSRWIYRLGSGAVERTRASEFGTSRPVVY